MSILSTESAVRTYLAENGLIASEPAPGQDAAQKADTRSEPDESGKKGTSIRRARAIEVTRFPGGVSNHVWGVRTEKGCWVVKQPLAQLATKEEWFSGTDRLDVEVAALQALERWVPENVPHVRFHDPEEKVCIMACAPEGAVSWKDQMMGGTFDASTAHAVGALLRLIHRKSRSDTRRVRSKFDDLIFFKELRIDPFHRFVAQKHPDLEEPIKGLIRELVSNRTTFVHGDYSPKNVLVDRSGGLTLIDLEVAHWGNPVFDVAYCLGHLMLKAWHLDRASNALESIQAYLEGYKNVPKRLIPHVGLMLLARIDGKSTVEYLTDPDVIERVRSVGKSMLLSDDPSAEPLAVISSAITE